MVMLVPGDKTISTFIEKISDAIGGLLKPMQMKRVAKAENKILVDHAHTTMMLEQEREAVKSGKSKIVIDNRGISQVVKCNDIEEDDRNYLLQKNAYLKRSWEEINTAKAVLLAAKVIKQKIKTDEDVAAISGNEIDIDWLYKWREATSMVSDEAIQILWANILAGEYMSPGKFSTRTIGFLRDLSKVEAEKISSILSFVSERAIIKTPYLKELFNYDQLSEFVDLGVLKDVGEPGTSYLKELIRNIKNLNGVNSITYEGALVYQSKTLVFKTVNKTTVERLPAYLLTKLGCELMELCVLTFKEDYFNSLIEYFKGNNYQTFVGSSVLIPNTNLMHIKNLRAV